MSRKVLVMIPAYNEEHTVGDIVKSTLELYPDFDVIVIDDGSEDKTVQAAKEAGANVVSFPFHCGGGTTIQTGYLVAAQGDYDYVVKIDADGQHKPEEIQKLLTPLVDDKVDLVAGSRYLKPNASQRSMMKEGGRVFSSTLVSSLWKVEVTDITCGMRGWNRKAIRTLLPIYQERGFIEDSVFWIVETLLARKEGLRMEEVPIEVLPRNRGKSKSFSFSKMVLYPLRLLVTLLGEIGT